MVQVVLVVVLAVVVALMKPVAALGVVIAVMVTILMSWLVNHSKKRTSVIGVRFSFSVNSFPSGRLIILAEKADIW